MQQWIVQNLEIDGFQLHTGIRFSIWWKGHLYLSHHDAGADSINALAQQLQTLPLSAVSHRLKGVFGLFVWDRSEATWQITVDNSGLYRVFFDTSGHVCASFFEIAAARGASPSALSTDALIEFLLHGCVYAPRTLLPGVRRIPAKAVLRLREIQGASTVDVERKWFPPPDASRPFAAVLDAHAADLERSLVGKSLSIDLTGGFDSRLVACLLRARGLGQEAAMTGEPASIDAALATNVSTILELPMHVQRQTIDRLDDDMTMLSADTDGLVDVAKIHRDWQAACARLERGITVLAHGGGGELLKDFYFHHEFPFYGRRPVSLERLYDLRIVPMPLADAHLTLAARCWVRDSRARLIQRLKSYRAPSNHETCDRAFFGLRLPEFFGGHFSTYINMGLNVVAPLMDRDVAMAAIALSPWSRLMEGQHRRLIEGLNARVAALPTANGYSASCRPALLARDLVGFAANEARRVVNKLGQRHLGRAPFPRAGALDTDAPGFADRMRQLPTFRSALAKLQERGIYAPGLDPTQVRTHEVGRILTLGLCFDRLGQAQHTARRSSSRLAAGSIARAS